jgi:hypothetical protein
MPQCSIGRWKIACTPRRRLQRSCNETRLGRCPVGEAVARPARGPRTVAMLCPIERAPASPEESARGRKRSLVFARLSRCEGARNLSKFRFFSRERTYHEAFECQAAGGRSSQRKCSVLHAEATLRSDRAVARSRRTHAFEVRACLPSTNVQKRDPWESSLPPHDANLHASCRFFDARASVRQPPAYERLGRSCRKRRNLRKRDSEFG